MSIKRELKVNWRAHPVYELEIVIQEKLCKSKHLCFKLSLAFYACNNFLDLFFAQQLKKIDLKTFNRLQLKPVTQVPISH